MRFLRAVSFLGVLVGLHVLRPGAASGQEEAPESGAVPDADRIAARVLALQDSLKATRTYRFGLSVGWRAFVGGDRFVTSPAINPADSTVRIDRTDESDVVLSGVVTAFPFAAEGGTRSFFACGWCGLGFVANLNLASFSAESVTSFNQSIEGGIGLATAMSNDFSLALTVERGFKRRLRDFVKVGEKLEVDGEVLTSLSRDDDRFFVDDNRTAISLKFVFFF